jgi:hypothetical protein
MKTAQQPKPRRGGITLRVLFTAGLLLALAGALTGCILPEHYSEWQWKQYNPEWKPLPGGPDR